MSENKNKKTGTASKMKKIIKILVITLVVLGCTALIIFVLIPFIKLLLSEEGRNLIQEKVRSFGIFAPILFMILQLSHIFIAFIPGEPIEIMAGVLFGTFWGMVLCEIGVLISSVAIYALVRKFGKPLVDAFVPEEKFKKFKFLHNEKKLETVSILLFTIPGTPKDLLTYIIALTDINPYKFYLISTIGRIPSVITSTFAGATLGKGKPITAIIIFLATSLLSVGGMLINNRITESRQKKSQEREEKK